MKFFNQYRKYVLQAPDDDKGGGGGKEPTIEELKAQLAAKDKEIEGLKAPKPDPDKDKDKDSLAAQAAKEREEKEKESAKTARLSSAIKFVTGSNEWLKNNASLLPDTIPGIFEQADKKKYGNDIEKESAIKVAIVEEYFANKNNLDQLTESQKKAFADFKELTESVKQERVIAFFDSVFEPALESSRKVKKAEALRDGRKSPSGNEDAYAKKIMESSQSHYLKKAGK